MIERLVGNIHVGKFSYTLKGMTLNGRKLRMEFWYEKMPSSSTLPHSNVMGKNFILQFLSHLNVL